MKYDIKSRFTLETIFSAELDVKFENKKEAIKMGEAVKQAYLVGADLSGADLRDADLSGADLRGVYLRGVYLSDANLIGANLRDADLVGANLVGADLSGADLRGADLRGAHLRGADLVGADLSGADLRDANLRGADLRGADLRGADLSDANLSDADLRGVDIGIADLGDVNLSGADKIGIAHLRGVPKIENIHNVVYEAASQKGAFDMSNWHTCETTHCRAGWVVHLAGAAGAAMECCLGTALAATLIYLKSDPSLEKIPDFYASNEDALADMKRLAGL